MPRWPRRRYNFLRDGPRDFLRLAVNTREAVQRYGPNPRTVTDPIANGIGAAIEAGVSLTPPIVWDMAREHGQDLVRYGQTASALVGLASGIDYSGFIPEASSSRKRLRSESVQTTGSSPPTQPWYRVNRPRPIQVSPPTFARRGDWWRGFPSSSSRSFSTSRSSRSSRSLNSSQLTPWTRVQRRLNRKTYSQQQRLQKVLKGFFLRARLKLRSRIPGRKKRYLGTALRQSSRRVLHLRKKYILAPRRWKPRIRRALAKALRQRYIARRRFRNA